MLHFNSSERSLNPFTRVLLAPEGGSGSTGCPCPEQPEHNPKCPGPDCQDGSECGCNGAPDNGSSQSG